MTVGHGRTARIAVVEASGQYAVEELRAGTDAALAAFGAGGAAGLLFDLTRSAALVDRANEEVRAMAYFLASRADRYSYRLAMVTGSDVAYGLMRVGAVVAESQGVTARVFRDRAAAMTWITGAA